MTSTDRAADVLTRFFGTEAPRGAYLDGAARMTSGERIPVEDPSTTRILTEVAEATDAQVADAVASARRAFDTIWRDMRGPARATILFAIAAAIRAEAEHLAVLETLDTGKPLRQSRGDILYSARFFEFYAGVADKIYGETIPGEGDYWAYTLREPYGVVAHITPWNSPISLMCRGVAPCLAAGNTVVVKPSEIAPLSTLAAAALFTRAGLPPGVCNIVAGRGPTVGAALVRHRDVAHITFTGSVPTGRAILAMAAERIVGCNLELGGKSPTIVMPDADFGAAVRAGALAVVRNSGQSCTATTRLLVHESIAERYSAELARAMAGLTLGPGIEDKDLGPLTSRAQFEKVRAALASGAADGATVLVGGTRPAGLEGYFLLPAVLTGVRNDMRIAQEEIFGPVQSVISFADEDEAVALANDSTYGLSAGVFTSNITTAHSLARRLQAGQVLINQYPMGSVETPAGGYKQSGLGRERGLVALEHYTQLKTVVVADEPPASAAG
ncbi:aldehyde dehydrogenase [Bradyrhizobium sp. 183]|uniref:aldehyde dehydrogenase family protein n=1 Tax=unclassified Bradyrhizobium TaxID=2631580 RepID=UPI001FFEB26B|nr:MULTISPECIES: aldehyde dehydrogenase family protein [unclassified Bradyrhizobium]UPJ79346.1 aldehyde dehydrogenase [Bradyrhizobium sp. 184]UPJ87140.1 aldehyde dehydrogenase [Bradyrhizobium sp. 183]